MPSREATRTARRGIPRIHVAIALAAALLIVGAALIGVIAYQALGSSASALVDPSPASSPTTAAPPTRLVRSAPGAADGVIANGTTPLRPDRDGALGAADGVVPAGTTVFDVRFPGVANLEPDLVSALRRAATDAAHDGVTLFVDSGWRSPEYQERLLQQAISKYGSAAEAARWVATPATSAHVMGEAVDIGHSDATAWLSSHGARYGLCQTYRNEPWHYELRPDAINDGCPSMYVNPTYDPRMQP